MTKHPFLWQNRPKSGYRLSTQVVITLKIFHYLGRKHTKQDEMDIIQNVTRYLEKALNVSGNPALKIEAMVWGERSVRER